MKYMLNNDDPAGWYECRWLRDQSRNRLVRWWSGSVLYNAPHDLSASDVREYSDFIPLVRVTETIEAES